MQMVDWNNCDEISNTLNFQPQILIFNVSTNITRFVLFMDCEH